MSKKYTKLLPQKDLALNELHQFYRAAVLEVGEINQTKALQLFLRVHHKNVWIALQIEWWAVQSLSFQRAERFIRKTWPDHD